jgi:hypothetical protein
MMSNALLLGIVVRNHIHPGSAATVTRTAVFKDHRKWVKNALWWATIIVNGDDDAITSPILDAVPYRRRSLLATPSALRVYLRSQMEAARAGAPIEVECEPTCAEIILRQAEMATAHIQARTPLEQHMEKGTEGPRDTLNFNSSRVFLVTLPTPEGQSQVIPMATPHWLRVRDDDPLLEVKALAERIACPDRVIRSASESIVRMIGQIVLAVDVEVYNVLLLLIRKGVQKIGLARLRFPRSSLLGEENRSMFTLREMGLEDEVVSQGEDMIDVRIPSYARVLSVHGVKVEPMGGTEPYTRPFFTGMHTLEELLSWEGTVHYRSLRAMADRVLAYREQT